MKKRILLYTMLAIFFATNAAATVWRVNNNPGVSADFSDLQTAINSSSVLPFDTLYVEGSYTSYGGITVIKPLILIGTGYFLSNNDSTQANKNSSTLTYITFNSVSSGSKLIGFYINGNTGGNKTIQIFCSDITISRNRIHVSYSTHANVIYILAGNLSGILIEKNYIKFGGGTGAHYGISSTYDGLSMIIRNNYIEAMDAITPKYSIYLTGNSPGNIIFTNNIIGRTIQANSAFFTNNIMIGGSLSGTGNAYYNNICNSTQFGNQNGNQQNVDMSTVFVNHTSGVDNGLLLKPDSPAIGAGFGGVDCGIFGGDNPYVLSGLPPIPSIFEATQSGIGSPNTPIQVNLKAKSNR